MFFSLIRLKLGDLRGLALVSFRENPMGGQDFKSCQVSCKLLIELRAKVSITTVKHFFLAKPRYAK